MKAFCRADPGFLVTGGGDRLIELRNFAKYERVSEKGGGGGGGGGC